MTGKFNYEMGNLVRQADTTGSNRNRLKLTASFMANSNDFESFIALMDKAEKLQDKREANIVSIISLRAGIVH